MRLSRILLPCAAVALSALHAEHNRLIPVPQQVHYGAGELAVAGLQTRFASAPSAADRFVAREIAAVFGSSLRHPVAIDESGRATPAINLVRYGGGAPLPDKKETAGLDSQQFYELRVTPDGAGTPARSSAGLFYGARTLMQLVEGDGAKSSLPAVEMKNWPRVEGYPLIIPAHGTARMRSGKLSITRANDM
jgi:N-acetyl-beta-hexosaminidase